MKQTMLVADGDAELCKHYRNFATEHGYEVETSSDGLDCVRKLRMVTPDLLVLDLELRWGGGDGVLGWLREEPKFLPGRIVLTSTPSVPLHIFGSLATLLLRGPVVKTLTKPFPLSALFDDPALIPSDEPMKSSPNRIVGGQRRGVLVVDDEPALREILQTHLQGQGFRVWTAANGEEALDHCCDHGDEIAVILLDVRMPGLDGPRTLDGIRAMDVYIPVCFMTGSPGDYQPRDLLRQGARHLFRKPLLLDEIVRVVRDLANEPVGQLQVN